MEIQQRIRLACGRGALRLWRNNTGALVDQQGLYVSLGSTRSSSASALHASDASMRDGG